MTDHKKEQATRNGGGASGTEQFARRFRQGVKSACESALVRGRVPSMYRAMARHRGVILAYHNVVPDDFPEVGGPSLHLHLSRFREQLDFLMSHYDVVSLESVLDRAAGSGERPVAAITFDDAYQGAVRLGVRELIARRLPGTLFVSPAFVDGGPFWWDSLGRERPGQLPPSFRAHAVEELGGDDAAVRRWALAEGLQLGCVPSDARCAGADSLAWAVRHRGITLAPHGWSHRNLTRLSGAELRDELTRPLEWLNQRYSAVLPWLAYPYGRFDPAVARACAREGYVAALAIGTGPVPALIPDRYSIPRVNVPAGISLEGFVLRASGLVAA